MPYYRVTLTFASAQRTQSDIALRANNAADARWYVKHRAEEWHDKPVAIGLKRISQAQAQAIVDDNGIDWMR